MRMYDYTASVLVVLPAQERLVCRCGVLAGLRERFGGEERVRCGDGIERVVREREGLDAGVDEGVVAGAGHGAGIKGFIITLSPLLKE